MSQIISPIHSQMHIITKRTFQQNCCSKYSFQYACTQVFNIVFVIFKGACFFVMYSTKDFSNNCSCYKTNFHQASYSNVLASHLIQKMSWKEYLLSTCNLIQQLVNKSTISDDMDTNIAHAVLQSPKFLIHFEYHQYI